MVRQPATGTPPLRRLRLGIRPCLSLSTWFALAANTDDAGQTAVGYNALATATVDAAGFAVNTAVGVNALFSDITGNGNTAVGAAAFFSTTGGGNTAIGNFAGSALTTGGNNIDIGNVGAPGESNTIRIGTQGTQTFTIVAGISNDIQAFGTPIIVTTDGYLGVQTSSVRFKDEIKPMDKATELLFALTPVTFRYKKEIDPDGRGQFGLVAEDVEKVNPDFVVRDKQGKPYSVRYDQLNAMLLNEFLKEHKTVEEQGATIARQWKEFEAAIAQQQKEIEALTATVKQQAEQIQKVSAQLEKNKPAPQTVLNNH